MTRSLLADVVDIRRWLDDDAEHPFEHRLERDRAIGAALSATAPLDRVRAWWTQVEAPDPVSPGLRIANYRRLARLLLWLLGVFLGVSLGTVAFAYDGNHPVNLLALLGVLVGVPFLLLLLTLVLLLPGRIPGLAVLRETLATMNPGRWVGAWLDRYSGGQLFAGFGAATTGFARWQLVEFSQWLALGYFLGVLLAATILVAVTDLAFGWSTTLELTAERVHGAFLVLAWPWQGWLATAVPDLALVEASRFFRLDTAPVAATEAEALGRWWPFVLMTILFWGLLPRGVLLLVSRWRLGAETRELLCRAPEVLSLLDRLAPPPVAFQNVDESEPVPLEAVAPAPALEAWDEASGVVIWNEAIAAAAARELLLRHVGTPGGALLTLGAGPDRGDEAFENLPAGVERVLVLTKGWEPPLLEFADFLGRLREHLGAAATIAVLPLNVARDGIDETDRSIWAEFLQRQGSEGVYVLSATVPRESAP
ncbi:MAG: DUF2868 domain-containing protein [Pseudomonadota bacterium]